MLRSHAKNRITVAVGPEMPGWGSWEWVGCGLLQGLAEYYDVESFAWGELPRCDVVVIIKHFRGVPSGRLNEVPAVVFCPVDAYGSVREIEESSSFLRRCSLVIVHSHRLARYFEPYAPVEYMDHHVRFVLPEPAPYRDEGFVLWVGVRSNSEPLIQWLSRHAVPCDLHILTNLEGWRAAESPYRLPISSEHIVTIEDWTRERHMELLVRARAAIDIKSSDFRSAHKPPAKAIDYIASGVPLAMNSDSSSTAHLAEMGFNVASPTEPNLWLSRDYWRETVRFGACLREDLSFERVMTRYRQLLDELLSNAATAPAQ